MAGLPVTTRKNDRLSSRLVLRRVGRPLDNDHKRPGNGSPKVGNVPTSVSTACASRKISRRS